MARSKKWSLVGTDGYILSIFTPWNKRTVKEGFQALFRILTFAHIFFCVVSSNSNWIFSNKVSMKPKQMSSTQISKNMSLYDIIGESQMIYEEKKSKKVSISNNVLFLFVSYMIFVIYSSKWVKDPWLIPLLTDFSIFEFSIKVEKKIAFYFTFQPRKFKKDEISIIRH